MELSKQVVNLELSKRLKELGVKQESYFYHCKEVDSTDEFLIGQELIETCGFEKVASAWTVAELGEMLPMGTKFEKYSCKGKPRFCVIEVESIANMSIHDHNEADARGKMLIYLIEQGLAKP